MDKQASIPILVARNALDSGVPAHDLHLHTEYTDGKPTIVEYIDKAIALGLEHIGFPEHCNLKTTWLTTFVPALLEERKKVEGKLRVHWGIEAKGMDREGKLAATPQMVEAAEYVYGAFHSSLTKVPFPELPFDEAMQMEFDVTIGLIKARSCHAIAHPGGLSMKYQGSFPNELWDEIAKQASASDIALELNPGYGADLAWQLDVCKKYDCKIVLGSNAHEIGELGTVVTDLRAVREKTS